VNSTLRQRLFRFTLAACVVLLSLCQPVETKAQQSAPQTQQVGCRIRILLPRLDRPPRKTLTQRQRMLPRIRLQPRSACPCRTIRSTELAPIAVLRMSS
jgi:hypothetical protein